MYTQIGAVLAQRMAVAEKAGAVPFPNRGGMLKAANWSGPQAQALSRAGHLALRRDDLTELMVAGATTPEHLDAAARALGGLDTAQEAEILDELSAEGAWSRCNPNQITNLCNRAKLLLNPPDDEAELRTGDPPLPIPPPAVT